MIARALLALAAAAASLSCGEDPVKVDLDLTGECLPVQIGTLGRMQIELYGVDDGGARCLLDLACITLGDEATIDAVEEEMRARMQPLVSAGADDAVQVAVVGFFEQSCGTDDEPRACGFGDLNDVTDGRLVIDIECDGLFIGPCTTDERPIPPCP